MKTIAFETRVNPDQTVTVPPEMVGDIAPGQRIQVFLIVPDADDQGWSELVATQFLQGYADDDAIYDAL